MAGKRGGARPGAGRKPGKVGAAKRALAEMAKDYAQDALRTLAQIATSGESEAARVSAATALLDRAYGRPPQSLAIGNPDGSPLGPTVVKIVAASHGNNGND
jgi:hypothetical protein